jgi:hypothetical protein
VASVRTPGPSAESTLLADLGGARRLALTRLSRDQTTELARSWSRRVISVAETRRLYELTEGNPLFVEELIRLRAARGPDEPMIGAGLPPTVLEVLRRSVAGVGTATAKSMVLNLVSVHLIGMLGTQLFWGANPRAPIGG